jgi:hypothetical protein
LGICDAFLNLKREMEQEETVGSANENAQVKEIKLPILLDSRLDVGFSFF